MCRHACPVSTASGRETYIPQVKMDRLNQLRLGRGRVDRGVDRSAVGVHRLPPLHDVLRSRQRARARAVHRPRRGGRARRAAPGAHRLQRAVPRARAAAHRAARDDVRGHSSPTEGEIGYWPGCDAIDKGAADIAAALALFERVGRREVQIVEAPQACAGYPLLAAGHRDLFRWHAGRVAASLRGFRKVAINCSACLYALRAQYAGRGRQRAHRDRVARRPARARRAEPRVLAQRARRSTTTTPATTRATTASSSSRAARSRSSPRSASSPGTRPTPSAAAAAASCRRRCRWSPIRWRSAGSPRCRPPAAAWSSRRARRARSC